MDTDVSNLELLGLFRRCAHLQRPTGVSHGQGRLLAMLSRQGSMTQRELAEAIERTPATLSQQLDAMEQAGLVVRERCTDDRRNVSVTLTDAGARAASEAMLRRRREADALFDGLSREDRRALHRVLGILVERWGDLGPEALSRPGVDRLSSEVD